jgi:hypothetical protein
VNPSGCMFHELRLTFIRRGRRWGWPFTMDIIFALKFFLKNFKELFMSLFYILLLNLVLLTTSF